MKKNTLLFICLVSVLNISATVYSGSCGDNAKYSLDTSTGLLSITGTGAMTNYSSNSSVPWCSKWSYIKTVDIADGVTYIGQYAFCACSYLTSVTIPNSVTSIGNNAFQSCSGLTSVTIPNSVTSIGRSAFYNCSGLTSVTIGNSVTSIGEYAFKGCSGLTSVTIGNSVTSIGEDAFNGCSGLTSVEFPNSVTSIGEDAFNGCSGLTSITIPKSVTSIGGSAFSGTAWYNNQPDGLVYAGKVAYKYKGTMPENATISIKEGTLGIANYAFSGRNGLTSIEIPSSVTSIGNNAFSRCYFEKQNFINNSTLDAEANNYWGAKIVDSRENGFAIKENVLLSYFGNEVSVTIPNSVTSIGRSAFSGCSGLASITIPNSVTSIEWGAFEYCSGLTSIEIPNSVTSIGERAFNGCKGLTSVTIPSSVMSIGLYAFFGCSGLTSVICKATSVPSTGSDVFYNVPQSSATLYVPKASVATYKTTAPWSSFGTIKATVISGSCGENVNFILNLETDILSITGTGSMNNYSSYSNVPWYSYTSSIKTVEISDGVTTMGDYAFQSCSGLTSIEIPNSITSIGRYAFYKCSGLTSIEIPNSVTSIGNYAFYGCSGLTKVELNSNAVASKSYSSSSSLNNIFGSQVKEYILGEDVTSIGNCAFYYCSSLTSIEIPNSLTSIGDYAFFSCNGLTSVTFPNSVTSIGYNAFYNCSGLTSIDIPNSVISIRGGAFSGCSGLTFIDIPNSVTSIGSDAFYGCSGLTSVTIPNSVTSIGRSAFCNCSGLTSIEIPNSVTSIGGYAFSGCSGLKSITIPNSVTSIGESAFSGTAWYNNQPDNLVYAGLVAYKYKGTMPENTTVSIKEGTLGIAGKAFYNCSGLTSVTIPNSVTSIGNEVFEGCSGLTSVTCEATSVPSTGSNVFYNVPLSSATLYVPNSALKAYKTTEPWNGFGNIKPFDFINGSCGENVNFILNFETGILTITGTGAMNSYSSYSSVPWYSYTSYIKTVEISDGVTSIGNYAFCNCNSLASVTIPNSVTEIGQYAFYGTNLKTLIVGTGMLSFGTNAFSTRPVKTIWLTNTPPEGYTNAQGTVNYVANSQYSSLSNKIEYKFLSSMFEVDGVRYVPVSPSERTCDVIDCVYNDSITEVSINPTVSYRNINMKVQNVQPYTFYQYTNIKKVSLDIDGSIGESVFSGCNNMQTVVLGENITGIGEYAFNNCAKLNSIIIPDAVTSIGQYAFSGCSGMKSVVIGDGPNTIGDNAFSGCSSLSSVTIGKGTNSIGSYAFSGCNSLASISLGEGTEIINQYAFQNCYSLTSITIPGSVNSIGNYAFSGCSGLKTVIMANRQTGGDLRLGCNGSNPLFVDCPLDYVYIGRNILYSTGSYYGYSPFYRNTSLRTVVITDKETDISENEFYGCTNLQNVQIGDGVTAIGNWAFSGCSSLKNFSFGTHVKTIGKEAFSDCTAVTAITSKAQTPPVCSSQALDDINKWDCVLYVPEGYASSYQNADQWKEFFFIEEKKFDLRGDANGDGEVDMDDATFVTNIILGIDYATEAADVNNDGSVNMADVMFIVNYIKNGNFPDE